MESLWRDVTYGARMLARSKGVTALAILTLALGIGANTAIFSVIQAILLRPLPYPQADRMVLLTEWSEQVPEMSFSVANLKDLRDRNTTLESLVGYHRAEFVFTEGAGEPERLQGRRVSSGLEATFRRPPLLGRSFKPEDDAPGAEAVALLGEGFWERRFGRDPHVVGRSLNLSGEAFTVIGVMPKSLHGAWKQVDVFTSLLRLEDTIGGEKNRGNHPGIYVVGRLKDGVPVERARADVKQIAAQLATEHPDNNARQSMTLESLQESFVGELRPALFILLGAVLCVLLIACANVANLLLARAAGRVREVAVRQALGADRARLIRQLLTESVLLSLAGGLLGVMFAFWGLRLLIASLPDGIPRADEIGLDGTVLAATFGVAVLTGLVFGLAPAFSLAGRKLSEPMREGGRGSVGPGHRRLRDGLVMAEVALALVLLVGAGLLLRSFFRVLEADAGYRTEGVLTARTPLAQARYDTPEKKMLYATRLVETLGAVPGVQSAALAQPLLGGWQTGFSVEGRPEPAPGEMPSADITRVTGSYFETMGVRLLAGRVFTPSDTQDAPRVAMIDETFAKAHFPKGDAIGGRVKFGAPSEAEEPWMEIVGVVGHVKNYGVDVDSRVELYLPFAQSPAGAVPSILVRTTGNPAALSAGLRQAVKAVDPLVPTYEVRTLADIVAEGNAERRLAVTLISVFASLALLLAAIGIYGVMSYAVAQRTSEIGIRMALGAERDHILGMVLRHGALMAAIGVGVGLVTALGLAQLLTSLLFQISATDPPTFSVVPVVLLLVAGLACYVPARRATRVDPLVALRYE
jgi:putative ABC transport system permease protein